MPDPAMGPISLEAVKQARNEGDLVSCEVAWSETRPMFSDGGLLVRAMEMAGVRFDPLSQDSAILAGQVWKLYLESGGERSRRVVADFLIGAHARMQADRLLTRDRGFYRRYFRGLTILDPTVRRS